MLSVWACALLGQGCSDEVLTIVAMLSVENVYYRPKEKQAQADQKKARFYQPEGDHLTLLAVYVLCVAALCGHTSGCALSCSNLPLVPLALDV